MSLHYYKVDEKNERLKTLIQQQPATWETFYQKLEFSAIFHDHGLEGVVLQAREIKEALRNDYEPDSSSLPTFQEIKNYNNALALMKDLAYGTRKEESLSEEVIFDFYDLLSKDLRGYTKEANLREDDSRYGAYFHKSCPSEEVGAKLKKLLKEINLFDPDHFHPIEMIARFHYRFMQLMPLGKLSGKVVRFFTNILLIRHKYSPAIIHTVERARYYEALASETEYDLVSVYNDAITVTTQTALAELEPCTMEEPPKGRSTKKAKGKTVVAKKSASSATTKKKTETTKKKTETTSTKKSSVSSRKTPRKPAEKN